jgi:hypothetical protein
MKKIIRALSVLAAFAFIAIPNNTFASHGGDKDCTDFANQKEAQKHWDDHGYSATNDPERLDRDRDGIPCEDDEGSGNSGNDNSNNNDQSGSDQDQDKGNTTEAKKGGPMPKTAINVPAGGMIGGGMALIGGIGLLALRRRHTA